jgi:hypothetical protein
MGSQVSFERENDYRITKRSTGRRDKPAAGYLVVMRLPDNQGFTQFSRRKYTVLNAPQVGSV